MNTNYRDIIGLYGNADVALCAIPVLGSEGAFFPEGAGY